MSVESGLLITRPNHWILHSFTKPCTSSSFPKYHNRQWFASTLVHCHMNRPLAYISRYFTFERYRFCIHSSRFKVHTLPDVMRRRGSNYWRIVMNVGSSRETLRFAVCSVGLVASDITRKYFTVYVPAKPRTCGNKNGIKCDGGGGSETSDKKKREK